MSPGPAPVRGLAVLALVFNAFAWGVSWWPFRQFEAIGLHPLWLTTLVYSLTVLVLLAARPKALREVLGRPALWVLVLASGTTNACFNWAVTIGDVVRVVLLFYLMPLWAVLLARPLLGERIGPRAALRVALALAGALVVLWPSQNYVSTAIGLPDALALLGGFSFALNNVMLRREAGSSEPARAMAMFGGGALVSLVLAVSLSGTLSASVGAMSLPAPAPGWISAVVAMAAVYLASNLALQYGAARLAAHTTAVVMITEVLFASASAMALGAGGLEARTAWGGALIIAAAVLAAWQRD